MAAPTEQTMGNVQRIFYYHVPSAWTAFLLFFINFVCSIQYLVRRDPVADKMANWTVIVHRRCYLHRRVRDPSAARRDGAVIGGHYRTRDRRPVFPDQEIFLGKRGPMRWPWSRPKWELCSAPSYW